MSKSFASAFLNLLPPYNGPMRSPAKFIVRFRLETLLLHVLPCSALCAWILFIRAPLVHPCLGRVTGSDVLAAIGTVAFWICAIQALRLIRLYGPPKPRLFQFSLRMLFVLMAAFAWVFATPPFVQTREMLYWDNRAFMEVERSRWNPALAWPVLALVAIVVGIAISAIRRQRANSKKPISD